MTGVTWPGVTWGDAMEEEEATPGAEFGPRSTLPTSFVLLPLPVLRCASVKGEGGVGRLISTELCCEGVNRASHGLLMGWAGI